MEASPSGYGAGLETRLGARVPSQVRVLSLPLSPFRPARVRAGDTVSGMEINERCRFWPHCEIHAGEERDLGRYRGAGKGMFSDANKTEMVELNLVDGWTYAEIAEDFGTWPTVVGKIVRAEHHRVPVERRQIWTRKHPPGLSPKRRNTWIRWNNVMPG